MIPNISRSMVSFRANEHNVREAFTAKMNKNHEMAQKQSTISLNGGANLNKPVPTVRIIVVEQSALFFREDGASPTPALKQEHPLPIEPHPES